LPDTRSHRGAHPEDARLFAPDALVGLRLAASDFCWLLNRGYASNSSLKLVGDRYRLSARQRTAVARSVCSDSELARREGRRLDPARVADRSLWLDGYNVLTTVEASLGGAVVLIGRDGTYRDMASMHGSYRKVAETRPALGLIGRTCAELGIAACHWYLDRPVSNSGRLKTLMAEVAADAGWTWHVELVHDPDPILVQTDRVVATADSMILDRCKRWFNLARETVSRHVPDAWIVELFQGP
jgi:hypothetical protein